MVIINETAMSKEHIKAIMRADNFENNTYKKMKLAFNLSGLLVGMVFVRFAMFSATGSDKADSMIMVISAAIAAALLYTGMSGLDRKYYKKTYRIFGGMVGMTFIYEIDSEGIKMSDLEGDSEFFEWSRIEKCVDDTDNFLLYAGKDECMVLSKKGFKDNSSDNFKELVTAVMALRREKQN